MLRFFALVFILTLVGWKLLSDFEPPDGWAIQTAVWGVPTDMFAHKASSAALALMAILYVLSVFKPCVHRISVNRNAPWWKKTAGWSALLAAIPFMIILLLAMSVFLDVVLFGDFPKAELVSPFTPLGSEVELFFGLSKYDLLSFAEVSVFGFIKLIEFSILFGVCWVSIKLFRWLFASRVSQHIRSWTAYAAILLVAIVFLVDIVSFKELDALPRTPSPSYPSGEELQLLFGLNKNDLYRIAEMNMFALVKALAFTVALLLIRLLGNGRVPSGRQNATGFSRSLSERTAQGTVFTAWMLSTLLFLWQAGMFDKSLGSGLTTGETEKVPPAVEEAVFMGLTKIETLFVSFGGALFVCLATLYLLLVYFAFRPAGFALVGLFGTWPISAAETWNVVARVTLAGLMVFGIYWISEIAPILAKVEFY